MDVTVTESPTVEVWEGEKYPIYNIKVETIELRHYLDEPTAERCDELATLLIDRMTDPVALSDLIRDELLDYID